MLLLGAEVRPQSAVEYSAQIVGHELSYSPRSYGNDENLSNKSEKSKTAKNKHTVYLVKVTELATARTRVLRRRYCEFRTLHEHLKLKYPAEVPRFPGRRLIGNSDPQFLKRRQAELQRYLAGILLLEPECRTRTLANFLECAHAPTKMKTMIFSPERRGESSVMTSEREPGSDPGKAGTTVVRDSSGKRHFGEEQDDEGDECVDLDPWGENGIVARTQMRLIDLAQAPTTLDQAEIEHRRERYTLALRAHIWSQPIDPIFFLKHKKSSVLVVEGEDGARPPSAPDLRICDPEKLVVRFPGT